MGLVMTRRKDGGEVYTKLVTCLPGLDKRIYFVCGKGSSDVAHVITPAFT
jgi:hypothetical protein